MLFRLRQLKLSKIPDKLRRMLQLLLEEQAELLSSAAAEEEAEPAAEGEQPAARAPIAGNLRSAGPCLEFLLNQRLVESLCMMGLADRPQGMMSVVLQTVYALVKHIKHPLLPHMSGANRSSNPVAVAHPPHLCCTSGCGFTRTRTHARARTTPGRSVLAPQCTRRSASSSLSARSWCATSG